MLKDWRKLLFWGGCAFFAGWILWWASSGYPLEGPICPNESAKYDCTSYNVIFYSAWQVAQFATHWSVLITAFATIAMGYFTFTLKESTDKLWIADEKQFTHVKKQASQAFLDRGADLNRLHDQMRIAQQSADAAKRTAEAAAQQAKVTEAALTQLERPYIFIFGVRGIRPRYPCPDRAPRLAWRRRGCSHVRGSGGLRRVFSCGHYVSRSAYHWARNRRFVAL